MFSMSCLKLNVLLVVVVVLVKSSGHAAPLEPSDTKTSKSALSSIFVDDVIVESTLSVRPKAGTRQGRAHFLTPKVDSSQVLVLRRDKRHPKRNRYPGFPQNPGFQNPGFQNPGFQNQGFPQFQPIHGSASSANAQAQGFESAGPLGSFGASAAGAGSQGFAFDETGIRGNAGLSGSQSYHLPNGMTIALSYANGFSVGPDGKPTITKGNSIAFSGPDGKPIPAPYENY